MSTKTVTVTETADGTTTTTTTTTTSSSPSTPAPSLTLATDTRVDQRIAAPFIALGFGGTPPAPPVTATSPRADILTWTVENEKGFEAAFAALYQDAAASGEWEESVQVVKGGSGQDLELFITKPKGATAPMPCIYHTHGGAMCVLHARDVSNVQWRRDLAAQGLMAVGVEFRNCGGADGANAFPAGLDDCVAGLQWVHDHRATLGISTITLSGESGGGNLALATAAKALSLGREEQVQGIYALCPYIAGPRNYRAPPAELQSLLTNDGIFISTAMLTPMAVLYTDTSADEQDPYAWPYFMTEENSPLARMPPTVISVNECDPLRDEGVALGRRLARAGVDAVTRQVMGTYHAGDLLGVHNPLAAATLRDIAAFATSV